MVVGAGMNLFEDSAHDHRDDALTAGHRMLVRKATGDGRWGFYEVSRRIHRISSSYMEDHHIRRYAHRNRKYAVDDSDANPPSYHAMPAR